MDRSQDYSCLEIVFDSALKYGDLALVAVAQDNKIHSGLEQMLGVPIGDVLTAVMRLELDTGLSN